MKKALRKTVWAWACAIVLAGILGGCSYDVQEARQADPAASDNAGQYVGMPNPFIDCDTLEEAEKEAGFEMQCPVFDDLTEKSFQAIRGKMIQIFNRGDGAPGNGGVLVRKAKGNEDISGDYNTYPVNDTLEIGGRKVTARGTQEGYVTVIWTEGEYSYAMDMDEICMPEELLKVYVPLIR